MTFVLVCLFDMTSTFLIIIIQYLINIVVRGIFVLGLIAVLNNTSLIILLWLVHE